MMLDFNQLLEKYDIKIKGILHVGAHEGGETLAYVKAGIKNVLLVEANPFRFSNLTESLNTGRYCVWCSPLKYEYFNESESQILKGYKAYNYAVSNRDEGTITFNLSNYDGGTDSIFKINEWGRDSSSPVPFSVQMFVPELHSMSFPKCELTVNEALVGSLSFYLDYNHIFPVHNYFLLGRRSVSSAEP